MDFRILYFIQSVRTDFSDRFWLFITNIAGPMGQIWVVTGVILFLFKKTRKCGFSVLLSYGLVYLIGNMWLKDLIARPRPCHIDNTVELLVSRPSSFSCPSTHSAWAFAGAVSILLHHRKPGWFVLVFSLMVAFSRMYLFVHFPSDVLFGAILGSLFAFCSAKVSALIIDKR